MSSIARTVFMIPLLLIVFALALRVGGFIGAKKSLARITVTPTQTIDATFRRSAQAQEPATITNRSIDLETERTCEMKQGNEIYRVAIKKKRIRADISSGQRNSAVVVKDDCIHFWTEGSTEGRMICGVGLYIDMFSRLAGLGLFSPDASLMNALSGVQGGEVMRKMDVQSILEQCQSGSVAEESFQLPRTVRFAPLIIPSITTP